MLKRGLLTLGSAASGLALAVAMASPAAAAPVVRAQPAAGCSSGWVTITNYAAHGLGIQGDGVNNPVHLTATPNCFQVIHQGSYTDPLTGAKYTTYEYQNGDGHCLWQNALVVELGGACTPGHPNEEFFGYFFVTGDGWIWDTVATGTGYYADSNTCGSGGEVVLDDYDQCPWWNFP